MLAEIVLVNILISAVAMKIHDNAFIPLYWYLVMLLVDLVLVLMDYKKHRYR